MTEIKTKVKKLNRREFYINYILLVHISDRKYAEILAILMLNFPNTTITEEVKDEIKKILEITERKEEYQNQMVSKSLSHLTNLGYLIKIQNGAYDLAAPCKYLINKTKASKDINLTFNFQINEH